MRSFTIDDVNNRLPINSRLTVLDITKPHPTIKGQKVKKIKVRCICGIIKIVRQSDVLAGHTLSCGCYEAELLLERNTKYSHHIPKLYHCYTDMIKRCYDSKDQGYKNYGAKGVAVCEEWRNDYQTFLTWALENGWKPGLQIDKDIKGTGKIYSPQTCCFVTPEINTNNRECSIKYSYKGEKYTLPQLSRLVGIDLHKLRQRIVVNKLPLVDAISIGNKKSNKWETKKYKKLVGV